MVKMTELNQKQIEFSNLLDKNRGKILGIVLIGIFMTSLDAYMVNIALPSITTQFNVGIAESQWIITGYLLIMTGLFILFGKVSEYTGKTKLFITGFCIFTISSLACGLSTGLNELIIFRLIQAVGASMVLGVGGALIFLIAAPEEKAKAIGLWGASSSISALLGPAIGGFITSYFGWQYLFFINIPIGAFLLIGALKYLKVPEITSNKLNIDWIGVITLFALVVSLLLFCNSFTNLHVDLSLIIYGAIFLISSVLFIFRESKCKDPILDLSIFQNKLFTLPIVSMMFYNMAIITLTIVGPFYFQGVMGYSPLQVGLLFMVIPLLMAFSYPISGKLYDKYHWKYAAGAGVLVIALSLILVAYAFLTMNLWLVILAFIIRGIGGGLFGSPNGAETMSALPIEKSAIASSVMFTTGSLAMAVGASLASVILTLKLQMAGYTGEILSAGSSLLSNSVSIIMLVAAGLCIISAIFSILRNINGDTELVTGENERNPDELNLDEAIENK
jgi:EmrB/QacA subfamily drug resistance transporter